MTSDKAPPLDYRFRRKLQNARNVLMHVQRDLVLIRVTYNTSILATQVNYGSGDSDIFAYDSNTLRMTQFKFNVGAQPFVGGLTWNANSTLNQLAINDPFNSADTQPAITLTTTSPASPAPVRSHRRRRRQRSQISLRRRLRRLRPAAPVAARYAVTQPILAVRPARFAQPSDAPFASRSNCWTLAPSSLKKCKISP